MEINNSKNTDEDDEDRRASLIKGTKYCERAFNGNNRNSAAANALFDFFLQKRDKKRALKLAERTIQFAETEASSAIIQVERSSSLQGRLPGRKIALPRMLLAERSRRQ